MGSKRQGLFLLLLLLLLNISKEGSLSAVAALQEALYGQHEKTSNDLLHFHS